LAMAVPSSRFMFLKRQRHISEFCRRGVTLND